MVMGYLKYILWTVLRILFYLVAVFVKIFFELGLHSSASP